MICECERTVTARSLIGTRITSYCYTAIISKYRSEWIHFICSIRLLICCNLLTQLAHHFFQCVIQTHFDDQFICLFHSINFDFDFFLRYRGVYVRSSWSFDKPICAWRPSLLHGFFSYSLLTSATQCHWCISLCNGEFWKKNSLVETIPRNGATETDLFQSFFSRWIKIKIPRKQFTWLHTPRMSRSKRNWFASPWAVVVSVWIEWMCRMRWYYKSFNCGLVFFLLSREFKLDGKKVTFHISQQQNKTEITKSPQIRYDAMRLIKPQKIHSSLLFNLIITFFQVCAFSIDAYLECGLFFFFFFRLPLMSFRERYIKCQGIKFINSWMRGGHFLSNWIRER